MKQRVTDRIEINVAVLSQALEPDMANEFVKTARMNQK